MPKLNLPLGVDGFGGAARQYYVDKTLLINDIINQGYEKSAVPKSCFMASPSKRKWPESPFKRSNKTSF